MFPARRIEASSAEVGGILEAILVTVDRAGALVHPEVRLRETDGAMSIHCHAGDPESVLVDMPREILVPIEDAVWTDNAEELRLESAPEGLTLIQRDLLDLHIALYNATEKIPWTRKNHPRAALREDPVLVAAIRRVRPGFGDTWTSVAETFLATRTLSMKPLGGVGQQERIRVLVPIADLVNHHHDGARFDVHDRAMKLDIARPTPGDECFANYGGRRDGFDLALQYGYVDHDISIARSAPLTVDVDGFGEVTVEATSPKRIHPLDPPQIRVSDRGLVLSHLTFDGQHPDRARIALSMAVIAVARHRGLDSESAQQAAAAGLGAVSDANLSLLATVGALAGCSPRRAAAVIREASGRQIEVITTCAGRRGGWPPMG